MADIWRVVDTGLRPAAQNIAMDRALLEARRAEEIPGTLRFLRHTPCALLGHQHSAAQEFHVEYCRTHDIPIQRGITGGAASYAHEAQLIWALYLHKRDFPTSDMRAISRRICHAAATAVSALGVDARFRARSDIEVDGRSLCGAGSAFDGDALLFEGTLHLDLSIAEMLSVLRMPCEPRSENAGEAARERYASLKALLAREPETGIIKHNLVEAFESEFDVEFRESDLTLTEHGRYQAALREIDTADWVELVTAPASDMPMVQGEVKCEGGLLRARAIYDRPRHILRQVWFTGCVSPRPARMLPDLEAALRDLPLDRVAQRIESFFASRPVDMAPAPDDFVRVLRLALQQPLLSRST
jgi:lipoate---protein ligase